MLPDSINEINQNQHLEFVDVRTTYPSYAAVFTVKPYNFNTEPEAIQIGSTVLEGFYSLVPVEDSLLYQLSFHYAMYSIRPETYAIHDKKDKALSLGNVSLFSESNFMSYAQTSTWATNCVADFDGKPLLHYQIGCLNHIIDVATFGHPNIDKVVPMQTTSD